MKMRSFQLIAVALTLAQLTALAPAENWPAWRGPKGDGTTPETELPRKWSATENVKWKIALPEPGNSTPIVWGDKIFLTQAVKERRTLMALDRKDGKVLWQEGPAMTERERTHATNPPCAASPVTDGERVIAWFGSAGVWCWDFAGKELWHTDLGKQDHEWGYGSSPILQGDLCIVNFGPGPRSFLVALDKRTGKEVWRTDVPASAKLEGAGAKEGYVGSWATPVIVERDGQSELVAVLPGTVRGFDLQTGKERWSCGGLNPVCYANPLVAGGTVVAMGGYGGYSLGAKLGGTGDVSATHRLWQETKATQRIGSGVVKGDYLYMPNENGIVQCIEPATGKIVWQERIKVPSAKSSTWSSIVLSGDLLYLVTQASDVVILKAAPKFEQVAVNSLGDGLSNSSLAVSNGELFIRSHKSLWCIGAAK